MQISTNGLRLIERFEGFVSCPYWDPYGQVWTRGYGEAYVSQYAPCVTQQEAENNLRNQIDHNYAWAINDLGVPLTQNQFDALCSFVYNLGVGSMQWDVGRELRARNYLAAANDMLAYDIAGGQVLSALVERRRLERALFLTPDGPPPPPPKPINPLDVLYPVERGAVNAYILYSKNPKDHVSGLVVIHNRMALMRQNIYDAATTGRLKDGRKTTRGWNVNHRYKRYQILKKYTQMPY